MNPGGRPLKFNSVKELEEKIDAYFASCYDYARDLFGNRLVDKSNPKHTKKNPVYIMKKVKPYTVTALALFLDTTRETLLDYESGKHDEKAEDYDDEKRAWNEQVDMFSDTIKKAKLAIYADTEEALFSNRATGAIFSLKNNYAWRDKTEQDITSGGDRLPTTIVRLVDGSPDVS